MYESSDPANHFQTSTTPFGPDGEVLLSQSNAPTARRSWRQNVRHVQSMTCEDCRFASTCIGRVGKSSPSGERRVEGRPCAFEAGTYLASRGERLTDVFMIRKGVVKSRLTAKDGRERVTNFHLPGELVGLEAVHSGRHASEIVALEHSECCRLSFDQLLSLAERVPWIQRQLLSLMSEQLYRSKLVAGDLTAEERVAVFLLDIRGRLTVSQPLNQGFRLVMSRKDIANYLHLTAETVSRVLTRFRRRGWVDITGRNLRSIDQEPLERLSREASVCE